MAAGNVEQINVILKMRDLFTKGLGRTQKRMQNLNKSINRQAHVLSKYNKTQRVTANNTAMTRISQQGYFKTMKMGIPDYKKFNEQGRKFNTVGGRMANKFRKITHGMRGFRMEALGVMFFGMMMQKMFLGLLQPVMEAFGIFDMFRIMLLVLFLPIMEMIFPVLMKVMEFFMNLSDPIKKVIGVLVIIGVIFGTVLMVLGQLALGIGSLIMMFGSVAGVIVLVAAAFLAFVGIVLLIAYFKDIGNASDKAKEKLVAFGISGEVFDKVKDKAIALFQKFKEKAEEYLPKVKEFFKEQLGKMLDMVSGMKDKWAIAGEKITGHLIEGVKNFFLNNPLIIVGVIAGTLFGGRAGALLGLGIGALFQNADVEKIDEIFTSGMEMLDILLEGLTRNEEKINEAITKIFGVIEKWIDMHINEIGIIGGKIGWALIKGIGGAITAGVISVWDGILEAVSGWMDKFVEFLKGNIFGKLLLLWANFQEAGRFGQHIEKFFGYGGEKDDFIWRPGQSPVSINPNDTVVGYKGAAPGLGGGEGDIIQENNFYGFTMDDLKRELDDRDRRLVDDVRRIVKQ